MEISTLKIKPKCPKELLLVHFSYSKKLSHSFTMFWTVYPKDFLPHRTSAQFPVLSNIFECPKLDIGQTKSDINVGHV